MKHTKNIFAVLCTVLIIAPMVAGATWWNPFSWFQKTVPPVVKTIENTEVKTEVKTETKTNTDKPVSIPTKPVIIKVPATVNVTTPTPSIPTATKPVSTNSSSGASSTTGPIVSPKVELPTYRVNSAFTASAFVPPRTIRTGLTVFMAEAIPGSTSQAIGEWYVDSVTWRLMSDSLRSGDLNISVFAGQQLIEDSSVANDSYTTKMNAHVVSDPISFVINGQVPTRGTFKIVVDQITGHVKGSTETHTFVGTPLVGADIKI